MVKNHHIFDTLSYYIPLSCIFDFWKLIPTLFFSNEISAKKQREALCLIKAINIKDRGEQDPGNTPSNCVYTY